MKRIIKINLKYRIRLLAIVLISFFLGSPVIVFGNSLMNDEVSTTIQNKSQIATDFDFSIESSNNEPYILTKGPLEAEKELVDLSEGDARPENRNSYDVNLITFFVFNQDGLAVQNAFIQLSDGSTAMTDEFGFANFALLNDAYLAEISKPNHETVTLDFIVVDGEELFLEILLIEFPPGSIQIICPPHVSSQAIDICYAIDIDLGEPLILDNSPSYELTNDSPLDGFPVGTTIVIWTVVNEWGETASCEQFVTVDDLESPIITPVPDITIDSEAGLCGASAFWDPPSANDNCEVETLEGSHVPGDFFPVGPTSVIYTATDVHGNPSYAGFTVEVIDVEPPIVTPLPDITIDNEAGECGASTFWDPPTASDNCEGGTLEGSYVPGDFFTVGSISVIYTATDDYGNSSYAGFTVEVIDIEPPIITPVADIIIDNEAGECGASASWDPPTVSDNCEGGTLEGSYVPGDFFTVGSTSVIYTATDDYGNSSYAGFTVEVIDIEPPIITPVADIIIDNEAGECGASASWDPPTVSDNCEGGTLEGSYVPGDFFTVGSISVIYTATDDYGNSSYTGFTVEVIDIEPPSITPVADITIDNEAGECGASTFWDPPTANDNCEGETLEGSHAPGDFFPVGPTSVIYTATDVHGNPSYAGFTVEVIDVEPPIVITLPDITAQLDASGNASIVAADVDDGSNDACGIAGLSVSPSTFTCTDVGSNTVTLTATDSNGNTNFSTATVTIEDNVGPTAICQDITIQLDASGAASIAAGDIDDGSSDACDIASLAIDNTDFDCADLGANAVTLTVTDNNGNQSTCTATVTVQESDICLDCAGVLNGTASIDECGICSGGDTGLIPNASCTDCEGIINGDALPGSICFNGEEEGVYDADCNCLSLTLGSLNGNVSDLVGCGEREITMVIYSADIILNPLFVETIDTNGDYNTPDIPIGVYDIYVTVEGYLSQLYSDVTIESGSNELDISGMIAGDIDGSNGININDVSLLIAGFGSSQGDANFIPLGDFNCDGAINIIDISILTISFGLVGDSPPSE